MKYSLDSEQGLQPLNEYDLWVLPANPWALIPPLQKNDLQCLMIPRTLEWTPSLINEPHLWGASIPETLLQRQSCLATQVHHGDETLLEQPPPPIVECLVELATESLCNLCSCLFSLERTVEIKYIVCFDNSYLVDCFNDKCQWSDNWKTERQSWEW